MKQRFYFFYAAAVRNSFSFSNDANASAKKAGLTYDKAQNKRSDIFADNNSEKEKSLASPHPAKKN